MLPARVLLLLVLVITPWWFGAVHESAQVYVFAAIACVCLCWITTRRTDRNRLPLVLVVLVAGVAFGLFQLCPLPTFVASLITPRTVQLRDELLLDQAPNDGEVNRHSDTENDVTRAQSPIQHTVSLRPQVTRYDLSLLVLSVAGFVLGSLLFCSPPSRLLLCGVLAVNGALLAFFGLLQKLTWNGQMFWIGPFPSNDNSFASFVNRNNAGGYLNLCLGGAIALMLWAANRQPSPGGELIMPPPENWSPRETLTQRLASVDAQKFAAAGLAALIVGGIFCTLSRGAGIALLGAAIITALAVMATKKEPMRISGSIIVLLAGVGLVAWVGMRDVLVERFGTLAEREQLVCSGRVPNWLDALRSVADFWPAGSGLGTYRDLYLLYQQRYDTTWYYYAENQYVQALVEAGLPGLLLLLLALAAVLAPTWRLLKTPTDPWDYAFAAGGLFAVTSQSIHSFFDFGLYLPANLLLMSVLCGAVTQRAADLASTRKLFGGWGVVCGRPGQVILVGSLLLGLILATRQVRVIAVRNTALAAADYSSSPGTASETELRAAIETLQSCLPASADDADLQYELAKAWTYLYRVQVFAELRRTSPPTVSIDQLWDQASPSALHGRAYELLRGGKAGQLEALRHDPLVSAHLRPALQHLLLARQSCPILAKIHLRLGQLCFLTASPTCDATHLCRARRLAPSDPYFFVEAGLLDVQAGRLDEACRGWQHALSLSEADLEDIVAYAIPTLDLERFVEQVVPPSPTLLLRLAKHELPGIPLADSQPLLLQRVELLAGEPEVPEGLRHYLLASVYALRGDDMAALSEYDNAVRIQPLEISWRHEYGQLLFAAGRLDEAREQIRWCARRQPESAEFRRLLEAIHKSRLTR